MALDGESRHAGLSQNWVQGSNQIIIGRANLSVLLPSPVCLFPQLRQGRELACAAFVKIGITRVCGLRSMKASPCLPPDGVPRGPRAPSLRGGSLSSARKSASLCSVCPARVSRGHLKSDGGQRL